MNLHFTAMKMNLIKSGRHYLDLDTDYAKIIEKIADDDKFLKDAASYGRGIRILNQNLWEIMVSFVISQNNNIPRITKSLNMLCEKFSQFPQSAALFSLKKEDLAGLGLGYRDEYIINLACYYNESEDVSGKLFSLGYEDAMKELMSIKGIGRKVAKLHMPFRASQDLRHVQSIHGMKKIMR